MIKFNKKDIPAPAIHAETDMVAEQVRQVRGGNYSCTGYQKLNCPQSEAEKGNMPFTDPEFTYDSISG